MDPFTAFCEKTVPRRFVHFVWHVIELIVGSGLEQTAGDPHVPAPLVIGFDHENYPILPSWDEDEGKPLTVLKSLLRTFFDELWSMLFVIYLMCIH